MKKIVIGLMGIFIFVGEYTILNGILKLVHLEGNMYISYILMILMLLFNGFMFVTYDKETIKNYENEKNEKKE